MSLSSVVSLRDGEDSHMVLTPGLSRYVSFEQWQGTSDVVKMLQITGDSLCRRGLRACDLRLMITWRLEEARLSANNLRGYFQGRECSGGCGSQLVEERHLPPHPTCHGWKLTAVKRFYPSDSSWLSVCLPPQTCTGILCGVYSSDQAEGNRSVQETGKSLVPWSAIRSELHPNLCSHER